MTEETKEEAKEETKPTVPEFKKPLVKMTAVELKEVAMEIPDAVGVTSMLKPDLLSLIKEYYGIEDEVVEKKKKVNKKEVGNLKRKVTNTKKQIKKAKEASDVQDVDEALKYLKKFSK
mgnify:CR=1 FL=1